MTGYIWEKGDIIFEWIEEDKEKKWGAYQSICE